MVSKEEIRIWKMWQFFDRNGFFPFQKKRMNFILVGTAIEKLSNQNNKSTYVEKLILAEKSEKNRERKTNTSAGKAGTIMKKYSFSHPKRRIISKKAIRKYLG